MAHHDLDHYFRTSMAVGPLVPIDFFPCNPADDHYLDFESLVNTQALLSPLYGSFRLKIMAFFAGTSLYVPKLWRNGSMQQIDGTLDADYPTFKWAGDGDGEGTKPTTLNPSHLLSYLGFPPYFTNPIASTEPSDDYVFNAIPLLMYWDIMRHYIVNRQETSCKLISGWVDNYPTITDLALSDLDNLFLQLPVNGGDITNQLPGAIKNSITSNIGNALAGMALGTYLPDVQNVILNANFYEKNVTSVQVSTSGGSFNIDQLVTAKKLWNSRTKDAMTSGTFKDWIRSHYGVTPKIMDDMPTFLGATSSLIGFEDIRATTYAKDSETTQYLGDKGSSGYGYGSSRRFRVTCDRPGYVMVLAQIVPRVDYDQRLERYVLSTKLSDEFRPEFNGIGLQDVLVSDLNASYENIAESGTAEALTPPWRASLGKQPAWIHYMTDVNKVRGTFCSSERSWVLRRDMQAIGEPDDTGVYNPVTDTNSSAYINPQEWNQPFALQSPTAQNFLVQFNIRHKVRSTVLKRLRPKF
ncbi:MAG: major capsid protein [Chaetfec virus UA24_2329]|nr:MAG: major capsid protein [Chaetfec virus UA24_2329]